MRSSTNIKEEHPQKYYLKKICNLFYYFGMGEFWYERNIRTNRQKRLYVIWTFLVNMYIFLEIFNELLAFVRKDLTVKEKGDLILFSFAHPAIAAKILVLYWKREDIVKVLQVLLEENRSVCINRRLDKKSVRRAIFYCTCLLCNIYIILTCATIEGIKNYLEEGTPIRTEVTFFPTRENSGLLINVWRFFIQFHWWFILSVMYSIDCLSICSLVFLSYKFKNVRLHFEKSRDAILKAFRRKTRQELDKNFVDNVVVGIKLHQDALRCARKIQESLGNLYSIQVAESISLLVVCLLKLTIYERSITSAVKNITFISCVILLNGTYMIAGGDVTHEASLIPDSVFHCGWEYATARRSLRSLVVVTLQCSQVPIRMTAFGVLSLSYNSLITVFRCFGFTMFLSTLVICYVLRLSYSFFAVMY